MVEGGRGEGGGPNPWEETLFHSHLQVHRGGVRVRCGKGIQNWGIEGIRTGTSDRFGRGRGEYISVKYCESMHKVRFSQSREVRMPKSSGYQVGMGLVMSRCWRKGPLHPTECFPGGHVLKVAR